MADSQEIAGAARPPAVVAGELSRRRPSARSLEASRRGLPAAPARYPAVALIRSAALGIRQVELNGYGPSVYVYLAKRRPTRSPVATLKRTRHQYFRRV